MLRLTVLGSGTSVPSLRGSPAHLVEAGDISLLLDCGSGCTTALYRAGCGLERLDAIFLTHLHPDHTAGLVPLLFALANPLHPERRRDLPLHGPQGTGDHLIALEGVYGRHVRPRHCSVRVAELSSGRPVALGPASCTAFAVEHGAGGLAYRVEHEGATLCFSGDSGPCEGLVRAARGVDLFLCECGAAQGEQQQGHLSGTMVGEIASAAGCRRVVLTHIYPHVERTDPVSAVQARFSGPVQIAADGQQFEVRGGDKNSPQA